MAKKAAEEKTVKVMDDRAKALETTLASLEKQFGKGTVMKLGEQAHMKVEVIPTGCLELDLALGVGGIPKGRIIEVYGPESSGKTTVALHVVAECQKRGGIAAFIDAEHALDPDYAAKLGVNIGELYVSQPSTGEDALEICEALVRSGAVDIVVVDSVAALVPRAEIDGEMGDSFVGLQARLMSQALRKLAGVVNKTNRGDHRRPRPEVLQQRAPGRAPRRAAQKRPHRHRQPHQDQGRQEQGGPALPHRGIRPAVRRGHQQGRQYPGYGGGARYHSQERRLVQL